MGILPLKDALKAAYDRDLDLVNIAPTAQPPVCKIMDYGKYRFEQTKREKEAKKNQKVVEIKEIRLGLSIDTHDFETKVKHALRFLGEGKLSAEKIRIAADKERANIIANAEAQAKEISAQGDVEAAKYLRVFDKNPELAAFLRKLDSLRVIMKSKTTLVLDTNTDPFTLLKSNADQFVAPAKSAK